MAVLRVRPNPKTSPCLPDHVLCSLQIPSSNFPEGRQSEVAKQETWNSAGCSPTPNRALQGSANPMVLDLGHGGEPLAHKLILVSQFDQPGHVPQTLAITWCHITWCPTYIADTTIVHRGDRIVQPRQQDLICAHPLFCWSWDLLKPPSCGWVLVFLSA